jgi:hypothetical protein
MSHEWKMRGGRGIGADRVENDFYPTPPWATQLLIENEKFPNRVWEPACGDGAMSMALADQYEVASTDLVARGFGRSGVDFLRARAPRGVRSVITNPPFYLGREFIQRATSEFEKTAMLFRFSILAGNKAWVDLLRRTRPRTIYALRERLPYLKDGEWRPGVFAHCWIVWSKVRRPHSPTFKWLSTEA